MQQSLRKFVIFMGYVKTVDNCNRIFKKLIQILPVDLIISKNISGNVLVFQAENIANNRTTESGGYFCFINKNQVFDCSSANVRPRLPLYLLAIQLPTIHYILAIACFSGISSSFSFPSSRNSRHLSDGMKRFFLHVGTYR